LFLILLVLGVNTYFSFKREDNSLNIRQAEPEGVPAIKSMPNLPKTTLKFDSLIHNFGVIKDDKKQYYAFEFTNTGKEPLMILGAEGSCGCTVPSWPRDPIAPGKSAKIEVSFDPNGKSGEQSKIVTVTSNTEPTTSILTITATIIKSN
jgi:hypothetical protein